MKAILMLGVCMLLTLSCGTPLDQIDLEPLLIEPGDLPSGVSGGQISGSTRSEFTGIGLPSRCNHAGQELAFQGEKIGDISVLLFDEEEDAEQAYLVLKEEYNALEQREEFHELVEEYKAFYWNGNIWRACMLAFGGGYPVERSYPSGEIQDAVQEMSNSLQIAVILNSIKDSYIDYNNEEVYIDRYQDFLGEIDVAGVSLASITEGLNPDSVTNQMSVRDQLAVAGGFGASYADADQIEKDFIEGYIQDNERGASPEWGGPNPDLADAAQNAALEAAGEIDFDAMSGYGAAISRMARREGVTSQQVSTYGMYQIALAEGDTELAQQLKDELGDDMQGAEDAFISFQTTEGLALRGAGGAVIAAPAISAVERMAAEAGMAGRSEEIYQHLVENDGSLRGFNIGDSVDANTALYRVSRGYISTSRLVDELTVQNILELEHYAETHEMETQSLGDMAVSSIVEIPEEAPGFQSIELLWKNEHAVVLIRVYSYGSFELDEMISYGRRLNPRLSSCW